MTKIIKTPILETERLILRPVTLDDAKYLQKHFNNWNIIKDLNDKVPWPYPTDGAYNFLRNDALPRINAGSTMIWVILIKDIEETPTGLIEYRIQKVEGDREDRGFWLAEPYWKKGYMSEAVTAVNDYIFFDLGRKELTVQNYADNLGSRRVKEKTGAVFLYSKFEQWREQKREIEVWKLTVGNWKKFREENK